MIGLIIIMSIVFCNIASPFLIPDVNTYHNEELITCVTNIVTKYIAPEKILAYVGDKLEDKEVLKAIHNLNSMTMVSCHFLKRAPFIQQSYFVSSKRCSSFIKRFRNLRRDPTWNPSAYFFIAVRSLASNSELKCIFDALLHLHVTNVVVINATAKAQLYSYNPFNNDGCGKHYENIINYGECSEVDTQNLFPDKYAKGLQNCIFNIAIPNWPPYSLIPSVINYNSSKLYYGVEPYLLKIVADINKFTFNIKFENDSETFSTVTPDMEAEGPLKLLQDGDADVVMGGLLLTSSRADAFDYVYDFLPYVDEIRFVVKQAAFVAPWKLFYLEFDPIVWALILISLTIYSLLMTKLLHLKDKTVIVFKLLDNVLLHGCSRSYHSGVKCVFIIWIWFAYLINMFYQSSLVSLNINCAKEYQIATESDIINYKLKPCFSEIMEKIYKDTMELNGTTISVPECLGKEADSLRTVNSSKEYFSLTLNGVFKYNIQHFYDQHGNLQIYLLKKPYSKVIYCMYFYKGFPLLKNMQMSALRIREMGLVGKAISDMNHLHAIKYSFRGNSPQFFLVVPWYIFIFGCIIATITFVIETFYGRKKFNEIVTKVLWDSSRR